MTDHSNTGAKVELIS